MGRKAVTVAVVLVGCVVLQTDAASLRSENLKRREPRDAEDEALFQSAILLAEEASTKVDEEVEQQFGFTQRSLIADEGPSLAEYYGTSKLWDTEQHNKQSKSMSESKLTVQMCRDLCDGKTACKSFSYMPEGEGWCGLKSKCVDKDTPAQKFPQDVFSTFFIQQGSSSWLERGLVADEGRDIETKTQQTIDSCKASCEAHQFCSSFTFHQFAGLCHLKDKCVDADEASSDNKDAKIYKTFYRPCKKWVQRDLVLNEGNTLETVKAPQYDCLGKCIGNPKCRSVSFKAMGSVCKLNDKELSVDTPPPPDEQVSVFSTFYRHC